MTHRSQVSVSLAALAVGCGGGNAGDTIDAPVPSAEHSFTVDTLPPLPETTVNAPVEFELTTAVRFLERQVPIQIGDIEERMPLDDRQRTQVSYQVRRGPFRLWGEGRTFYVAATIHYMARGWYDPPVAPAVSGSCGTTGTRPRAQIVIAVEPRLTPDWRLVGNPRVVSLKPLTATERDQCEITFLNIDVTSRVLDAAREIIAAKLREVTTQLAATAQVRKQVASFWAEVQQPIALEDSVWLMLRPQRIRMSTLEIRGSRAHGFIGVDARPTIITGPKPAPGQLALSDLGSESRAPSFSLAVEGRIGYFVFERELRKELIGSELDLPGGRVQIQDVTVSPADSGRIAVGLRLGGTTSGTIYFAGQLQCDSVTGKVAVGSFDYDATTVGLLVRGLAWLKAVELRQYVHDKTAAAISSAFDHLTQVAVRAMNRDIVPGVRLRTTLNGSQLSRILLLRNEAVVHARAGGAAEVEVTDAFLEAFWQ